MSKKTNETGHVKNLTGFEGMIAFVKTYDRYRPTNPLVLPEALGAKHSLCEVALEDFKKSAADLGEATRQRTLVFKATRDLGTRIVGALDGSNVSEKAIQDAIGLNRKLQGRRARPKEKPPTPEPGQPAAETDNTISVSQRSFDRQADNLGKLRDLLAVLDGYMPADPALTVDALTRTISELKSRNRDVLNAESALASRRAKLDLEFYDPETGMLALARKVKGAVRSIYKTFSVEYRQLTAIKLKNLRKKTRK